MLFRSALNAIGGEAGTGDTMEDLVKRSPTDPMDASPPMQAGDIDIFPASDLSTAASLTIRQRTPMPLDILSVTTVLQVGDG